MKEISNTHINVIERAYDTKEECMNDILSMLDKGYEITSSSHDIYSYYRSYMKSKVE